jgi:beta-glucosidase
MPAFPRGFSWGVATSAYQIEGAVACGGRTPSVWDTFCARPGVIADGLTGEVACDHYHRWAADLDLLAGLGVKAYRFSVSWPRIQPAAGGPPNPAGLDFYDRLVSGLCERGITPVVTLFHWDLPQWAQDLGGWQSRDTAGRFADYAAMVAARLGDRVGVWTPVNEMFEHCILGHLTGQHAPGLTLPLEACFPVAHHLLLGHGLAVQALRAAAGGSAVMAVNSFAPGRPASDAPQDQAATALYDVMQNRFFVDPVLAGSYPKELEPLAAPSVRDGDLDVIASPIDLLGVNYYSVNAVRASEGPVPLEVLAPPGYPVTATGWAVSPDGLAETLATLRGRYQDKLPPVVVSESGCAYDDTLVPDGAVPGGTVPGGAVPGGVRCDDPDRVRYLEAHVHVVREALADGIDVRGFFVWSLMDNFEWAEGYTKRFGLVHVDYATQARTPKASYHWYRELIQRGDAG